MGISRCISRFLLLASLSLCATTGLTIVTGCGNQQKPAPVTSAEPKPQDPTQSPPKEEDVAIEPKFNAPDALARKTAEYSQQVQSAMVSTDDSLNAPSPIHQQPQAPANQIANQPVSTKSPNALDLGKVPPATPVQPQTKLEASPASANQTDKQSNATDKAQPAANTAAAITPQTNAGTVAGSDWGGGEANSTDLAPKLTRKIKDYPRDVSGHFDYQLLRFLLDDRVPDLAALTPLPTEDRELLNTLIDGLVNFRSALRQDNNMLLSRKVKPLLEMSDRLRSQADLSIPTIALCTAVRRFGDYDPIDTARFAQGKDHGVVLYCEVQNFSSQMDEHQVWHTKLSQEAVLYSENGMQVWADKNEPLHDTSRQRRHDFFTVKKLTIPANLAVGRYLMKVTIIDDQVNRVAEATIPIVVAVQ